MNASSRPISRMLADVTVILVICTATVVMAFASFRTPGSPFDEGFGLAYPLRVLDGAVPHRDFSTFYGPGNPWLIAGAFVLAGKTQDTERGLGVLYRLLLVLAAAGVARIVAGRWAALTAAGLVVAALAPLELGAYVTVIALGCMLGAISALVASLRTGRTTWAGAAGVLVGTGLLMRPDFLAAMIPAAMVLLLGAGRRNRLTFAACLVPGVLTLAIHALIVGSERLSRVVSDMRASGPGRRLPFDLASDVPTVAEPSRLLVLTIVLAVAGIGVAVFARQRDRDGVGWRAVIALALLASALVPYALSRLDYGHGSIALIPALCMVPVAAGLLPHTPHRARMAVVGGALIFALACLVAPVTLRAPLRSQTEIAIGHWAPAPSALVRNGSRSFRVRPELAPGIQQIVYAAERERRAGARTLIVAPADLRRAFANDTYLYFLLADLHPATRYMEFNPLTVNRAGSGIVGDLRRADLLILNSAYDNPGEPNDSRVDGPDAPNDVVRRQFCEVGVGGSLRLLRRCRG